VTRFAAQRAGVVPIRTVSVVSVLTPGKRPQTLAGPGGGPLKLPDARDFIESDLAFHAAAVADSR
jgi:hypothetical protein